MVLVAAPLGLLLFGHPDDGSLPWPLVVATRGTVIVLACVVAAFGDGRRALASVRALGLVGAFVAAGWLLSLQAALVATGWVQLVITVAGIAVVRLDPRPLAVASALWLIQASVLVSSGFDGSRTFALQTAMMVGGGLSGLFVAGMAGRRWLPVTTR